MCTKLRDGQSDAGMKTYREEHSLAGLEKDSWGCSGEKSQENRSKKVKCVNSEQEKVKKDGCEHF